MAEAPALSPGAASSSLQRERKLVTVLFTDLSNSTAISERLDPEEMHRLMNRCFDLMLAELQRYGGTLADFTGDGLMAIFGAPVAHEDHAQRALLAALAIERASVGYRDELLRTRRIDFRLRCGLNTGLAVVGSFSDALQTRYTATGDMVNVASRMLSVAGPGEVVITEATFRAVGDYFVTEPLGEQAVKGKSQPIRAYRVLRARAQRTRMDAALERGLTPYVGRRHELAILADRFERVRAGHGQIVCLMGEPGIGKSRLLLEFRQSLDPEKMNWLTGRCISYGQSIGYLPVIDLVKQAFDVSEEDDEQAIGGKIERGVLALGNELQPHIPFLKYLLSVNPGDPSVNTMDARFRRVRLFEAMRDTVLASARRKPLVLAVEDLHWMDQTSEQFLQFLAESLASGAVLLLLTYRPGYLNPLPENTYTTRLVVPTLSADESTYLAEGALATREIPVALCELIAHKAEGNPFFVEEMLKSLVETRALVPEDGRYALAKPPSEIYVPDRVQDVIMARIDRLEEEPRQALQLASVIGREFTARLLERISDLRERLDQDLTELKTLEFILQQHLHPELAYMFKHAMTHDVAYGSLLIQRRKELHALVARAIEDLYAERLPEHYETLAYHYEQGEQWEKGLDYLVKAGEKLQVAYATREALSHFERALRVSEHIGESDSSRFLVRIHRGIGTCQGFLNNFALALESIKRMAESSRRSGDQSAEAEAFYLAATASTMGLHEFEQSLQFSQAAKEIALRTGNRQLLASSEFAAAQVYLVTGQIDRAEKIVLESFEIFRASGDRAAITMILHTLGAIRNWRGLYQDATASLSEGAAIGLEIGFQLPVAIMHGGLALAGHGEYDEALSRLEEGLALARRIGDPSGVSRILNSVGWIYGELQWTEKAIELNRQALAAVPKGALPEIIRNAQLNLGENFLALGNTEAARQWLEKVYADMQQRGAWGEEFGKWRYSQRACHSLGELRMAEGKPGETLALAEECLKTAEETQSRKNIVKGRRLKGQTLLALGKPEEARIELDRALAVAEEIGNPPQLWKTHAAIGDWHKAQGHPADAQAAYASAVRIIDGVAAKLQDADLKRTFLAAVPVLTLREAAGTGTSQPATPG